MREDMHVQKGKISIPDDPKILEKLAEGDPKSLAILRRLFARDRTAVSMIMAKGLTGSRIWDLYEAICGKSLERFIYHVNLELPCQCCGRLYLMPCDYAQAAGLTREGVENHLRMRQNGKPNSFWAFEGPPSEKDYEYPIVIVSFSFEIG
jgi:hypothetical protein